MEKQIVSRTEKQHCIALVVITRLVKIPGAASFKDMILNNLIGLYKMSNTPIPIFSDFSEPLRRGPRFFSGTTGRSSLVLHAATKGFLTKLQSVYNRGVK